MDSVADEHRAAHGFPGLRKRYIRRAQFLVQDIEFRAYVGRFREIWNREYPMFEVKITDPANLNFVPERLFKAWQEHKWVLEKWDEAYEKSKRNGATHDELFGEIRRRIELVKTPAPNAMDYWIRQIELAVRRYFPIEDFPNPYPNHSLPTFGFTRHFPPGRKFVGTALQTDPRLISDFETLFDPMELEPVDLFAYGPGPNDYIDEAAGETWDDDIPA